VTIGNLVSREQITAIKDHFAAVGSEQPIARSDSEELIAKLPNETLLAKFLDVNANFIALGPLARQFDEPRYSQLRAELYRIDLEIRRRGLLGTPEHKAAVKAAHDQAWQVHIARPRAPNSPVPGSRTGDRESADAVARQDTSPASTSAVPSRMTLAAWRNAIFALGHRWGGLVDVREF